MRRGCRIVDYNVTLGSALLDNEKLDDDRLVVRLMKDIESYGPVGEAGCSGGYKVTVRTATYKINLFMKFAVSLNRLNSLTFQPCSPLRSLSYVIYLQIAPTSYVVNLSACTQVRLRIPECVRVRCACLIDAGSQVYTPPETNANLPHFRPPLFPPLIRPFHGRLRGLRQGRKPSSSGHQRFRRILTTNLCRKS